MNKLKLIKSSNNNIKRYFSYYESHQIEVKDDLYLTFQKDLLEKFYDNSNKKFEKIQGFCSKEGSLKYSKRKNEEAVHPNHFKKPYKDDILISSIGIGTYKGRPESIDDLKIFNAVSDSIISGGINHIDTAVNYRYMKSQRAVGAALRNLIVIKDFSREELFVSSKIGLIPEDADNQSKEIDILKTYDISSEDIVNTSCLHPNFLKNQLQQSLDNLGLSNLDTLYLQNPIESQLAIIGQDKFVQKLEKAFEFMELCVQDKKINSYGIASWNAFRCSPEDVSYISLNQIMDIAQRVGGSNHSFKYVQTPFNVMMPEILFEQNQKDVDKKTSFLTSARENQVNVVLSSPLMNGTLIQIPLPTSVFKCSYLAAKHLQLCRSIPSDAIISTLIGQKTSRHVKTNLEVIQHDKLEPEEFWSFFKTPVKRQQMTETPIDMEQ